MLSKESYKMDTIISENEKTWDTVADQFIDSSALPVWGPFGVGKNLKLIPNIKGKTFLEIGCGSGRSIKYLTNHGAKTVYGMDLSNVQLKESARYNKKEIDTGKVKLFKSAMEKKIRIPKVDYVISVYAIGWTPDPKTTLKNIYSYLKPGGLFIWSWDHTFFTNVQYRDKEFILKYSYHEEKLHAFKNWKKEGTVANVAYRKTATWFQLLRNAGFEIIGYYEPKPVDLSRASTDPTKHYSIQKAEKVPSTFIFVCKKVV